MIMVRIAKYWFKYGGQLFSQVLIQYLKMVLITSLSDSTTEQAGDISKEVSNYDAEIPP